MVALTRLSLPAAMLLWAPVAVGEGSALPLPGRVAVGFRGRLGAGKELLHLHLVILLRARFRPIF